VALVLLTGEERTIGLPPRINDNDYTADQIAAREAEDARVLRMSELGLVAKQRLKLSRDVKKGFTTVTSQCSEGVRSKLEVIEGWDRMYANQELHTLINSIRGICVGHDDTNQGTYNLVQSVKNFYAFYQKDEMSIEDYEKDFKAYHETSIAYRGALPIDDKIHSRRMRQIEVTANNPTNAERARAKLECDEEFLGCLFISSSNQKMYGNLKKELHNNFLMGRDSYPRTLESAKRLLAGYKPAWTP